MIRYAAIIVLAFSMQLAFAVNIDVTTDKTEYRYGDYLTIIVSVSEVTQNTADMYIIGPDSVRSSPIKVQIKEMTTTISSPNSFDSSIFKEGKYQIEVEYDGASDVSSFHLRDAGNVFVPIGGNVVISQWQTGVISDHALLKFLKDNSSISIDLSDNSTIPDWFKRTAAWWLEKRISDEEFLTGMQYLINQGVIF